MMFKGHSLYLLFAVISVFLSCTGKSNVLPHDVDAQSATLVLNKHVNKVQPFDTLINDLKIHIEKIDSSICLSITGKNGFGCRSCQPGNIYNKEYAIKGKSLMVLEKSGVYYTNIFVMDSALIFSLMDSKPRAAYSGVEIKNGTCRDFSSNSSEEREWITGEFVYALLIPEHQIIVTHSSASIDSTGRSSRDIWIYKILKDRFQAMKYVEVYLEEFGDCFYLTSDEEYENFYRKVKTNKKITPFLK